MFFIVVGSIRSVDGSSIRKFWTKYASDGLGSTLNRWFRRSRSRTQQFLSAGRPPLRHGCIQAGQAVPDAHSRPKSLLVRKITIRTKGRAERMLQAFKRVFYCRRTAELEKAKVKEVQHRPAGGTFKRLLALQMHPDMHRAARPVSGCHDIHATYIIAHNKASVDG